VKRLALVSPLPPARSGVAEFSKRVARELSRVVRVEARESGERAWLEAADERLYQIGNNALHSGAYEAALAVPGVVELHDAVLHHFLLGRLSREKYVEEIVYSGGEWERGMAEELWLRRGDASSDAGFFARPLLRRVVESARAVIVHNPGALRRVREARSQAGVAQPMFEIPHYVDPPEVVSAEEVAQARRELGLDEGDLLISCFGFQRPPRRLRSVLRVVKRLARPVKLLVAGAFVSVEYEQALAPLLGSDRVVRLPFLSERELAIYAASTDVCVNLRSPSAGETSGIAVKLMARGKPVVVTDSEEVSAFPNDAVVGIDSGEAEEEMLAEALQALLADAGLREAIGAAAARHIRVRHGFEAVLPLYLEALGLTDVS